MILWVSFFFPSYDVSNENRMETATESYTVVTTNPITKPTVILYWTRATKVKKIKKSIIRAIYFYFSPSTSGDWGQQHFYFHHLRRGIPKPLDFRSISTRHVSARETKTNEKKKNKSPDFLPVVNFILM